MAFAGFCKEGLDVRYLFKFYHLTIQQKILIIEAYIFLGIFQMIISTVAFKHIAPRLGEHMQESPDQIDENKRLVIKNVSWAVNTMSRHTFWESKCLVQAITAKYMLRRRDIKSTLYLGVARDEQQAMMAHAWLRSGPTIVTGAQAKAGFVTLSSFGDK